MNTYNYFYIIVLLFTIGQLATTAELLSLHIKGDFNDNGFFSWRIIRLDINSLISNSRIERILDRLLSRDGLLNLIIIKLICLISLLAVPAYSWSFTGVSILLVFCLLLIQFRNMYGGDGSDQMALIIVVSIFFGMSVISSQNIQRYCLYFIALQSCLAYLTSGLAKLFSKKWRSGQAVYEIFNTGSYGDKKFSRILKNNKYLNLFLCWNVIVMETLFPLCLVTPLYISCAILLWGFIFHFFNVVIMGLNSFFWVFVATYPAIFFVMSDIKLHLQ